MRSVLIIFTYQLHWTRCEIINIFKIDIDNIKKLHPLLNDTRIDRSRAVNTSQK